MESRSVAQYHWLEYTLMTCRCPYVAGNTITLEIREESTKQYQAVKAVITKVIEPFTFSPVVDVLLEPPVSGLEGHMILKLYDRRFATQLRKDEEIAPWTLEIEQEYRQFVLDGGAAAFIAKLRTHSNMVEEEGKSWNAAQNEAYLYNYMRELYDAEIEVYRRVQDIQGKDVPRLMASFPMLQSHSSLNPPDPVGRYADFPAILLELIQGFALNKLAAHAPRETWQYICEDAIRIVDIIGDRNIRNEDVSTRNFIVRWNPVEAKFKAFMIDFALCKFRRQDQDERDWREWKAIQDEEGAVGFVMQRLLKGGFVYHRSVKYLKLDEEFKAEES